MKVLLAIEDKKYGKAIVDFILKNNWDANTKFKILHVIEPYELDEKVEISYLPFLEDTRAKVREMAKSLVDTLAMKLKNKLECPVESSVVEGHAKEKVLEAAENWKPDLLCVGSHGRKGLERFLLGSVSQAVAGNAPCAVLVVREPHSKEA